jgi:hypothetical protein
MFSFGSTITAITIRALQAGLSLAQQDDGKLTALYGFELPRGPKFRSVWPRPFTRPMTLAARFTSAAAMPHSTMQRSSKPHAILQEMTVPVLMSH